MSWFKGFNFRATSGYVADGTDETYVLLTDIYPVSRNDVTFGLVDANAQQRDRNSALDRRLAGVIFGEPAFTPEFKVALPAAGDYIIRAAFGDAYGAVADGIQEVLDDASSLFTIDHASGFSSGSELWRDANDALRTEAAFVSSYSSAGRTVTFASTLLRVKLGTATRPGRIAHLSIEQVSRRFILTRPA